MVELTQFLPFTIFLYGEIPCSTINKYMFFTLFITVRIRVLSPNVQMHVNCITNSTF